MNNDPTSHQAPLAEPELHRSAVELVFDGVKSLGSAAIAMTKAAFGIEFEDDK